MGRKRVIQARVELGQALEGAGLEVWVPFSSGYRPETWNAVSARTRGPLFPPPETPARLIFAPLCVLAHRSFSALAVTAGYAQHSRHSMNAAAVADGTGGVVS